MKKVLFVTYGGGHVNVLVPIMHKIKNGREFKCDVIALTTAPQGLKKENINFYQMKDFADLQSIEIGKTLVNNYYSPTSSVSYEETVAYYGCCMRDLIDEKGKEEAYKLLQSEGRRAFLPIRTMKDIIGKVKPDLVITTSSPRGELAALLAAESLGIPTIRIEQFFATRKPLNLEETFFCVINDFVKNKLIQYDINANKIFVTGQPAFDRLSSGIEVLLDIKKKLKIPSSNKLIVWASQKTNHQKEILLKLDEIVNSNDDISLVVKLHPNESIDSFENIDNTRIIFVREYLYELLLAADLVLTEFSTVGLEAILLDKALLTINISSKPDIVPYAESGAAIGVYNLNDLEPKTKMILNNERIQDLLEINRKSYNNDGLAADRIYELVQRILLDNVVRESRIIN